MKKFVNWFYGWFKVVVEICDECLIIIDVKLMFFELGGYKKLMKDKIDSVFVCVIFISWIES